MRKLFIITSILCFIVTTTFVQAAEVERTSLTQNELLAFAQNEKAIKAKDINVIAGEEDPWILLLAGIGLIVIVAVAAADNSDSSD